jgi:hypothetical protein
MYKISFFSYDIDIINRKKILQQTKIIILIHIEFLCPKKKIFFSTTNEYRRLRINHELGIEATYSAKKSTRCKRQKTLEAQYRRVRSGRTYR